MERYSVTGEDMKRYHILKKAIDGLMSLTRAAEVLGLSYRQVLRLKKRFLSSGIEGIIRKKPPYPPNAKVTDAMRQRIIDLRKNPYYDFNILHFRDKLNQFHGISLSYETVRSILIKEGLHTARTKRKIYRRRRRMPEAGLLVQMDSSQHRWIKDVERPWWLIAMIDDADGYVYAELHPAETTEANMKVIKEYILKRGCFMSLYTDKASHFTTTRKGGLHYNVSLEQKDTQIKRALSELGIGMINANSPQAKGRVERLFRFLQDRLIKEMRLKQIKDYTESNRFLKEEFLPWYNQRYTIPVKDSYRPLPKDCNLETIFCIKHPRKVGRDNTTSYKGKIYQLLPLNGIKSYALKWIDVCETLEGEIKILLEGKIIPYAVLEKRQRTELNDEEILSMRELLPVNTQKRKYIPPPEHPWRKRWRSNYVTFQTGNKM